MSIIDTSYARLGFHFHLKDKEGLADLLGVGSERLFHPDSCFDLNYTYLEPSTPQPNLEIVKVGSSIGLGGTDIYEYTWDNLWQTAAARLVGLNSYYNGQTIIETIDPNDLQPLKFRGQQFVKTQFTDAAVKWQSGSIGFSYDKFPDFHTTCLRIFSPQTGMDWSKYYDEPGYEKRYFRENFIVLLDFIEQAYAQEFITPMVDKPSQYLKKLIQSN